MAAKTALIERWNTEPWTNLVQRINKLLKDTSPNTFAKELERLPYAEEVAGYVDLRGAPIRRHASGTHWTRVDLSWASTVTPRPPRGVAALIEGPFSCDRCVMDNCRFVHVRMSIRYENRFLDCNLQRANLLDSRFFNKTRFERCDLRQANFRKVIAEEIAFVDCNLAGADFGNAHFWACDFSGSDLSGIRFNATTAFPDARRSTATRLDARAERLFE